MAGIAVTGGQPSGEADAAPAPSGRSPKTLTPEQQQRLRLVRGVRLKAAGDFDGAALVLDQFRQEMPPGPDGAPALSQDVAEIVRVLENWSPPPAPLRPMLRPETTADVMQSAHGPSSALAVVFLIARDGLMVPIELIDAELARRGVTALYLHDRRRWGFAMGVRSIGPDYVAMMDFIRLRAEEVGARRLVTIGASITGCAAVAAALHLKADAGLLFSPVVASSSTFRSGGTDTRRQEIASQIERSIGERMDVNSWYAELPHRPRMDIFYGQANANDTQQAGVMRDFDGVTCHPLPKRQLHNVLWHAYADGWIGDVMDRTFGQATDGAD